jgi:RNA polymerase sigma-70 factor, ECF subfamily
MGNSLPRPATVGDTEKTLILGTQRAPARATPLRSIGTVPTERRFEAVLAAAQRGEEWALSDLYRRLQPALLGYLRTRRPYDAEDIASETWIAVAHGLTSFRGREDDFRSWVFTIGRHKLIDFVRRDGRRPTTVPEHDGILREEAGPDAETAALGSLAARETLARIAELSEAEAEVILLRVVGGLSARDVAAITGRTSVSVRVTQHRALKRLARVLSETLVTIQSRLAL